MQVRDPPKAASNLTFFFPRSYDQRSNCRCLGDREMGEWEELFRQADERLVFNGGFKPDDSSLWILEAEWTG